MKNNIKLIIILQIIYFSNQSLNINIKFDDLTTDIGKVLIKTILDIDKE